MMLPPDILISMTLFAAILTFIAAGLNLLKSLAAEPRT